MTFAGPFRCCARNTSTVSFLRRKFLHSASSQPFAAAVVPFVFHSFRCDRARGCAWNNARERNPAPTYADVQNRPVTRGRARLNFATVSLAAAYRFFFFFLYIYFRHRSAPSVHDCPACARPRGRNGVVNKPAHCLPACAIPRARFCATVCPLARARARATFTCRSLCQPQRSARDDDVFKQTFDDSRSIDFERESASEDRVALTFSPRDHGNDVLTRSGTKQS